MSNQTSARMAASPVGLAELSGGTTASDTPNVPDAGPRSTPPQER